MLSRPKEFDHHCAQFPASLMFRLTYGKELGENSDILTAAIAIIEMFIKHASLGAHLVDTFPILDKLPDFLAPWRLEAKKHHEEDIKLARRLTLEVKDRMEAGEVGLECFAARLWDTSASMQFLVDDISYIAGSAFEAGVETTAATLLWFLMAMVLYPHTMKKAQEEIDSVVGSDGLFPPSFEHFSQLPYCVALTKELLRWGPSVPVGTPHYSDRDDEYKGYQIDAKTMVIPCTWTMNRNEGEFPDPYIFNPDRYLHSDGLKSHETLVEGHSSFGFGRRICPGQYLAAKNVWIAITRLLWGFDITPGLDGNGHPVQISPGDCTSGLTSKPIKFPANITIRSENHGRTIKEFETGPT